MPLHPACRVDDDVDRAVDRFDECGNRRWIAQSEGIDAIGACGEIHLTALNRRSEARVFLTVLEMENIAARIEHDRYTFLARSIASRMQPRGCILGAADRAVKPILQIDPDHTGLNDLGDMRPDFGRRHAVSSLNICCHRYVSGPHDTRGCGHHLGPGSDFAVGIPQCPSDAAAGCRQCIKPGSNEEARAQCVPYVRQ